MSNRFRHVLTDLCHVVHVVNNVFGLWDDFIFGQHRVHDVHSFCAHVVRQLINREVVVLVEQRHCNKHIPRFSENQILRDVEAKGRFYNNPLSGEKNVHLFIFYFVFSKHFLHDHMTS